MSKRRVAAQLMFNRGHIFRGHTPPIVISTVGGTGTIAADGIITVAIGSNSALALQTASAYLTVSSGTNIGTLVGTYQNGDFPI